MRWNGSTAAVFLVATLALAPGRTQAAGAQSSPGAVSADGRFAVFHTADATVLGPGGDTNGVRDVFVRDRLRGLTTRVSVATGGFEAGGFGHLGPPVTSRWPTATPRSCGPSRRSARRAVPADP